MVKRKTTILVVDAEPQTRRMLLIALHSNRFHQPAALISKTPQI
jgi:hypothetical protein